jgi:hypothetical protein
VREGGKEGRKEGGKERGKGKGQKQARGRQDVSIQILNGRLKLITAPSGSNMQRRRRRRFSLRKWTDTRPRRRW